MVQLLGAWWVFAHIYSYYGYYLLHYVGLAGRLSEEGLYPPKVCLLRESNHARML